MSNPAVTLLLAAKTEKGWRLPVAFGRNGKIRPQYALVDGVPVHFPGSYYALRPFEGSKTVWTTVGERNGRSGRARPGAASPPGQEAGGQSWRHGRGKRQGFPYAALHQKEMEAGGRGKRRAIETMTIAIDDFLAVTGQTYPDQIVEDSMLALYTALRNRGNSDRTIYVELRICRSKTGKHPSKSSLSPADHDLQCENGIKQEPGSKAGTPSR
jgi:hypothetical protein